VNQSRPPPSEGDVNVLPARAEWRASLSDAARAALDEDERYFLRQSLSTPCLAPIVRAEGAILTDVDGRRIFDFHGNSVHQLGHGHPKVVDAIRREMESLPFCPRRFANATALARRLVDTAPGDLDKVLFAPSGAAAISMALKLAATLPPGTRRCRSGTRSMAPISTRSASAAKLCSAAGWGR
jgi:4-aminobutyrate aminotransferase